MSNKFKTKYLYCFTIILTILLIKPIIRQAKGDISSVSFSYGDLDYSFNLETGKVDVRISANKYIRMQLILGNDLLTTPLDVLEWNHSMLISYVTDLQGTNRVFSWKLRRLSSIPIVESIFEGFSSGPKKLELHIELIGIKWQMENETNMVHLNEIFLDLNYAFKKGHVPKITLQTEEQLVYSWNVSSTFLIPITIGKLNSSTSGQEIKYWYNPQDPSNKTGLIGQWKMNEGFGQTVFDDVMNNDGTLGNVTDGDLNEPTRAVGKFGYALNFDGEDDFVKIPSSTLFDLADNFSFEAWVYPRETTEMVIAGKSKDTYLFYIKKTDDHLHLGYWINSMQKDDTTSIIHVKEWNHVALVFANTTAKLYVNGLASGTIHNPKIVMTSLDFLIGKSDDHKLPFNGLIDEVRLYNRTLRSVEILSNYKTTISTATTYSHCWILNGSNAVFRYDFNYSSPLNAFINEVYVTYPKDHDIKNITYSNNDQWNSQLNTTDYKISSKTSNNTLRSVTIKQSTLSKLGNESYRIYTISTYSCGISYTDFEYLPLLPRVGYVTNFYDKSSYGNYAIVEWLWDFGDGSTSTQKNPSNQYNSSGNFLVTLITVYENLETDLKVMYIKVFQTFDLTIEVKDWFGLPISFAEINLLSRDYSLTEITDHKGIVTVSEILEGDYLIEVRHMGKVTTMNVSLSTHRTEKVIVNLSIHVFLALGLFAISILTILISLIKRRDSRQF